MSMATAELAGHTALVTGGTTGIGFACAQLLAADGARVIVTGRDERRGANAVTAIGAAARFVRSDLSDLESLHALAHQAGDVDILVNNAAAFPGAMTTDQTVAAFDMTFDTNVRGTYFLTAALVRGMVARGGGSIINVSSMVASHGVPGASVYSASKAAVESLTRTWATEFGPHGVRINCVSPVPRRPTA